MKQPKGIVYSGSWRPDVSLVTHLEGSWGPSGVWDASPIKSWTTGGTRDGRYGSEQPEHWSLEDRWRSAILYNWCILLFYLSIYNIYNIYMWYRLLLLFNVLDISVRNAAWKSDKREESNVYWCILVVHLIHPLRMLYILLVVSSTRIDIVDSKATPPQMPPSNGLGFLTHYLSFQ